MLASLGSAWRQNMNTRQYLPFEVIKPLVVRIFLGIIVQQNASEGGRGWGNELVSSHLESSMQSGQSWKRCGVCGWQPIPIHRQKTTGSHTFTKPGKLALKSSRKGHHTLRHNYTNPQTHYGWVYSDLVKAKLIGMMVLLNIINPNTRTC